MHLRPLFLVVATSIVASRIGAQEVRIEVVELANGKPVVGANVTLVDTLGLSAGGEFSDQTGHIVLRAPVRGPYRVRADKVGYESWTSVILQLTANPIHVRVGMSPLRNPSSVIGVGQTVCQQMTGPGTAAGDLWIEIKKALAASSLTETQGLVPLDIDIYERVLDRNGTVTSEKTEERMRVTRRPVLGISADQLDTGRRGEVSAENVYRAPDPSSLLSDQFVKNHCFAAIRGYGAESGLAGLEFKPARVTSGPELTGVLWLDPAHNTLKSLAFDYVNLPIPLRIARTTGRLDFQQLPSGQWIVPRWYVRMPRVSREISTTVGAPATTSDVLVGYQEVGGTARLAGTRAQSATQAATAQTAPAAGVQSVINGVVYDSTSGRPLRDVQVSTGGGRFKTQTSDGGRYELVVNGPLSDKVIFEHPRLRLLRVPDRVQTLSVPTGGKAQAVVIIPSYGTLRRRLCGQNETGSEAQGIAVGYVRDASGNPIFNAHVWTTWQILWIDQNGRLIATNQQRTAETDTGPDGSYMLCGFTRGAQITAKVSMAGMGSSQEKIVLPPNMVLEHDFKLGAR
ncbi:MAG: carboxypeptidase-like regulatory domain-containing protein [Gemmatimonadaceae bacterium]